jgi:hypothetical protein
MRYELEFMRAWVAWSTHDARSRPIVMENWYPETMAPRTDLGAISDMYRMMIADTKPTPIPAMRRPGTSKPTVVEATCRVTPTEKTRQPAMIVERRPHQSARDPAKSAPKKVPAERMDVIRDFSQL